MSDDSQLLQRFAHSGDQGAFAEVVRLHVDLVYSAALRQVGGDDHLARDVSQAVFTALARSAGKLTEHASLTGWLYTTTRFLAAKAVREHVRWRGREQKASAMRIEESAGATEPNWEQLRPALDDAMHRLNAADRQALLLRFFENLPFAAVGARCDLSENSARMRVERALEKLRHQLAQKGITSTAAALGAALTTSAVTAAPAGLAAAASTAALASLAAGGVGAGALSFFLTMSTTKTTVGVVTALLVLAAGAATFEAVSARRFQTQLDSLRQSDSSRIHVLETQLARTEAAEQNRTKATAAAAAMATAGNSTPSRRADSAVMQVMSDPKFALAAKLQLAAQYAPLIGSLHLSPDQIEKFNSLLAEKRAAAVDAMAAAAQNGLDAATHPREFYMSVVAAETPINSAIASLLGPDGFSKYQDYTQGLPAGITVHLAEQALSFTDSPLTDAQASRLTQVMKANSPQPVPEPFQLLNVDLGLTTFTPQAKAAVAGFLSLSQIQALEEQIAGQNRLLQARMQLK